MANQESTICINPATGEKIGEYPVNTIDDLNEMLIKARKSQAEWALLPVAERIRKIKLLKDFIIQNIDKISSIISEDNGKTRLDGLATEVFPAVLAVDYYCNNAKKFLKPKKLKQSSIMFFNKSSKIVRIPYGVVGIISPWNYPFAIPFSEVIMGLLAGNAVILKAASETQLVGHILKECIEYAGLPDGIFNYINMPGRIVGDAFLETGIDKLFFTGSTLIGKYLMEKASKTLTPLVLELGGKDAMIVCDDANLERAANGALWAGFQNSGQSCGAVERIYVDEKVYEPFLKLLKGKIETLRVGYDTGFNSDIGSMTTKKQLDTVKAHLEDALNKGAIIYAQSKTTVIQRVCLVHPMFLLMLIMIWQ
jgi:acyl-CoA reductase-like NAD-dependent aldehyde dehydrogenase